MKIAGWDVTKAFSREYPQSRPRLDNWRKHVRDAVWEKPMDVIKTFNSASNISVKKVWVFNIGSDWLIAVIDFTLDMVLIQEVMTHTEYMKWSNRK